MYWQYCFDRYTQLRKERDNLDERIELLRALGVTKDAWLQNRLLTYVMTLPSTEITPTLEAIASTPTGEIDSPKQRLDKHLIRYKSVWGCSIDETPYEYIEF